MSRRRSQIRFPFLVAVLGVVVAISAYVFALPQWQSSGEVFLRPVDLYIPRAIDVVVVVWCFWVGSSIGSFLNVVAWRMPRGESINGRSHCPRCCAQLRARDNLPVFGWLALGGRCYSCHLPISIRYPLVEGAVGLSITAICVAELYQLNLPGQIVHAHRGPLRAPVVGVEVLATLLYHVVALATSWACGLIRLDGNRLPKRLVLFAAIVLMIPMLVYPSLMIVPWQIVAPTNWKPNGLYLDAVVRVVTALAAATVLGRYLARAFCPNADPKLDPLGRSTTRLMDLIVILAIPSIVVGWQALIGVTAIASLFAVVLNVVLGSRSIPNPQIDNFPDGELGTDHDSETIDDGFRAVPPPTPMLNVRWEALGRFAIAIPISLAVQIVFWRHLHAPVAGFLDEEGSRWWPSDGVSPWVLLSWLGIVFLIPLWLRDGELDSRDVQLHRDRWPRSRAHEDEVEVEDEVEDSGQDPDAARERDPDKQADA